MSSARERVGLAEQRSTRIVPWSIPWRMFRSPENCSRPARVVPNTWELPIIVMPPIIALRCWAGHIVLQHPVQPRDSSAGGNDVPGKAIPKDLRIRRADRPAGSKAGLAWRTSGS